MPLGDTKPACNITGKKQNKLAEIQEFENIPTLETRVRCTLREAKREKNESQNKGIIVRLEITKGYRSRHLLGGDGDLIGFLLGLLPDESHHLLDLL